MFALVSHDRTLKWRHFDVIETLL